jgi:hypothetical protein
LNVGKGEDPKPAGQRDLPFTNARFMERQLAGLNRKSAPFRHGPKPTVIDGIEPVEYERMPQ